MRRRTLWVVMLVSLISITLLVPGSAVVAEDPFDGVGTEEMPTCLGMPDAQVEGYPAGAACRVPARLTAEGEGLGVLRDVYRSGWTSLVTSESDSDLVEDMIKVQGWLYWIVGGSECFDDSCVDTQYISTHAACRTSTSGSGDWHQNGRHYFHTDGFGDDDFQTDDYWTS